MQFGWVMFDYIQMFAFCMTWRGQVCGSFLDIHLTGYQIQVRIVTLPNGPKRDVTVRVLGF